jgi:hypothetical protein
LAAATPVPTVQKEAPFDAIASHDDAGRVRAVHVAPSGLVATVAESSRTTQNTLPFQAIADQYPVNPIEIAVHVIPSGLVHPLLLLRCIAQNTLPFHAIENG